MPSSWSALIETPDVDVSNVRCEDGEVRAELRWTHSRYGPQVATVGYLHRFDKWKQTPGPLTVLAVAPYARTLRVQAPDGWRRTVRAFSWQFGPACYSQFLMDRYLANHPREDPKHPLYDPNAVDQPRRKVQWRLAMPRGPRRPTRASATAASGRRSPAATR